MPPQRVNAWEHLAGKWKLQRVDASLISMATRVDKSMRSALSANRKKTAGLWEVQFRHSDTVRLVVTTRTWELLKTGRRYVSGWAWNAERKAWEERDISADSIVSLEYQEEAELWVMDGAVELRDDMWRLSVLGSDQDLLIAERFALQLLEIVSLSALPAAVELAARALPAL